jgi:hypothetical protein
MNNVEIIDDFLPEDIHKNIYDAVFEGEIPVFYKFNTIPYEYGKENDLEEVSKELDKKLGITDIGHPFFTHMFFFDYKTSSDWDSVYGPILDKLDPLSIIRAKLNMNVPTKTEKSSGWHYDIDTKKEYRIMIYHINSNNGYTLFEDGTKIESVANRAITFPGKYIHTGISNTDGLLRSFMNFNYVE